MEEGEIEDGEIIDSDGGGGGCDEESIDRDVSMARSIMAQLEELRNAEEAGGGDGEQPAAATTKKKKKKKKRKPIPPTPELAALLAAKAAASASQKAKKQRANYVDHDRVEDNWMGTFSGLNQGGNVPAPYNPPGSRASQHQITQPIALQQPQPTPSVVPERPSSKRSPNRSPSPPGLYDSPYESSDDQYEGPAGGHISNKFPNDLGPQIMPPMGRNGSRQRGSWKKNLRKTMKKRKPFEKGRGGLKARKNGKEKPRLICKFFFDGKCSKGKDCTYSHDVEPPKKMSLCKFYLNGFCAKSETCLYMHKDFPCKFFHTGAQCYSEDNCKFSHEPLTEEKKKILDRYLDKESRSSPDSSEEPGPVPRPSLLGSPPRQHREGMGGFSRIPSLFDIDVKPPQMIMPPPMLQQLQQQQQQQQQLMTQQQGNHPLARSGPHFYGERMMAPPNGPFGPFPGNVGMPAHPPNHPENNRVNEEPAEDWEREIGAGLPFGLAHVAPPPGHHPHAPSWMSGGEGGGGRGGGGGGCGGGGGQLDPGADDWMREMGSGVPFFTMGGANGGPPGGSSPQHRFGMQVAPPNPTLLPPLPMGPPTRTPVPETPASRLAKVPLPLDIDERYLQMAKAAMYRLGEELSVKSEPESASVLAKPSDQPQCFQPEPPKAPTESTPFHPVPWRHLAVEENDAKIKQTTRTPSLRPEPDNEDHDEDENLVIDVKEEPTSLSERDRSSGSESDQRRSPPPASFAVPSHLPKRQRELFMRIQQQQQQQRLQAEDGQEDGDKSEMVAKRSTQENSSSNLEDSTESGVVVGEEPVEAVRVSDEEDEDEQDRVEKERWYSSDDDDDDDEDRPMVAVLKKLQQQPVPVPRTKPPRPDPKKVEPPPPMFNITKMLQSIGNIGGPLPKDDAVAVAPIAGSRTGPDPRPRQSPRDVLLSEVLGIREPPRPTVTDPRLDAARNARGADPRRTDPRSSSRAPVNIPVICSGDSQLPRDPRNRGPAPMRDPRLLATASTTVATRTSIDSPPPPARDPRLAMVSSSTDALPPTLSELRASIMKRDKPLLPTPRCDTTSESADRPAAVTTNYQHIPYRLQSVAVSHPNYSSLLRVSQSDPKLLFTDPRLKRQMALGVEKNVSGNGSPPPPIVIKKEKAVPLKTEKPSQQPPPLIQPVDLPPLPSLAALTSTTTPTSEVKAPDASHQSSTAPPPRLGVHRLGAVTMPAPSRGESLVRRLTKTNPGAAYGSPSSPRIAMAEPLPLPSPVIAAIVATGRRISSPASPPQDNDDSPSVAPVAIPGEPKGADPTTTAPRVRKIKPPLPQRERKSTMDYASPLGYADTTDDGSTASGYDRRPRAGPLPAGTTATTATTSSRKRKAPSSSGKSKLKKLGHSSHDVSSTLDDETPAVDDNTSLKDIFMTIDPTASPFC